jgi:hypothetical protein
VTTGADRAFKPSKRFEILHGTGVSRQQAVRTLSSVLYNHDSIPDVVTFSCELSVTMRRGVTFAEAAAIAAAEGVSFDPEGWFVDREIDEEAGPDDDR